MSARPYAAFAARLRDLLARERMSGRELAEAIGASESYVSKLTSSGEHRPSPARLREIARRLKANVEELEYLAGYRSTPPGRQPVRPVREELERLLERVTYEVPVFEQEAAAAMAAGAEPISYVPIPPGIRPTNRDLFAVTVRGESLEPEIRAGDVVVIDPDKPADNGDYVVASVDGEVMIKRYLRQMNGAQLAGKSRVIPFPGSEGDRIIGVVVYSLRSY